MRFETAKREIFAEIDVKNIKFIENFRQEDVYIIEAATSSTKDKMIKKILYIFLR